MAKRQLNNNKVDFIGIGAYRAGTTWIYECLKEHPQICVSHTKELIFFNEERRYKKGIDYYLSYFRHCPKNKIKGEFSPQYMQDEKAPERIKKHFPEVKLISCLRNPIERAHSHYYYGKGEGVERSFSFEEALTRRQCREHLIGNGLYYTQLKRYLELFPKENILILIYEDIFKNPVKFIQNIYRLLGIHTKFIPKNINKNINPATMENKLISFLKIHLVNTRIKETPRLSPLRSFLSNLRKQLKKPYSRPPMREESRIYLQKIFQEEINNLEKLLNRDLSFWQ